MPRTTSAPAGELNPGAATGSNRAPAVVARQGIYDSDLRLVAYELLFRPTSLDGVQVTDGDAATAQVLVTAFGDVGLDALVGRHRAFVNVPYAFFTSGYCATLPSDRVVVEILEDVDVDRRVIAVARRLVASGHTLALDDFVFRPGIEPLVELAEIVKLDVLALTPGELARHVELLRPYDVELLAEKVESIEDLPALRAMGFSLFQGFALQRPTSVHAQTTDVNASVLLQILADVQRPDISAADLVATVGRDPSIVYALLRILNSADVSLARKVTSLHEALVLFGIQGLTNWTTMMIMSRLAPDSHEALSNALIRARMCELGAGVNRADPTIAFTAGLLSTLPETLGRALPDIVDELALGPELRRALLDYTGAVGEVLAWTLAYEDADQALLTELGAPATIAHTYLEAAHWSSNLTTAATRE